jgi:hypothetical protein
MDRVFEKDEGRGYSMNPDLDNPVEDKDTVEAHR